MSERLLNLLGQFADKRILVVGDVMLDKYIFGETTRISQEAPVKIVDVKKESYAPGGAANAAKNISSLGAKAFLVGVIGAEAAKEDEAGIKLRKEIDHKNIEKNIIAETGRKTTEKIRVMNKDGQLIRIDYETKTAIKKETEARIISYIESKLNSIEGILVSDYAKGVITKSLIGKIKELASKDKKIVVIDPKQKDKDFYKNVSLITPNDKEACLIAGVELTNDDRDIEKIGKGLMKELNTNVLITRGEKGMSLFEKNGAVASIPSLAREVKDVSGAGDTVASTAILALAAGATLKEAAMLASHAAGIVVGKMGTETVTIDEIKKSMENEPK